LKTFDFEALMTLTDEYHLLGCDVSRGVVSEVCFQNITVSITFLYASHPVVYNNIELKYKPNSCPTQPFIKQIYNICGDLHTCCKFV
jgi:hypothetical protein